MEYMNPESLCLAIILTAIALELGQQLLFVYFPA